MRSLKLLSQHFVKVSVAQFLRGHMEMRTRSEKPQEKTLEERLPPAYQKVLKQAMLGMEGRPATIEFLGG